MLYARLCVICAGGISDMRVAWSNRGSQFLRIRKKWVLRSLFSLAKLTLNLCCTSGPRNTHRWKGCSCCVSVMREEEGRERKQWTVRFWESRSGGGGQWFWTFPFHGRGDICIEGQRKACIPWPVSMCGCGVWNTHLVFAYSSEKAEFWEGQLLAQCLRVSVGARIQIWMQVSTSLCSELLVCVLSSCKALVLVVRVISCFAKAEMLAPSGGNSRFLIGVICCLREIFAVGLKKVGLWRCGVPEVKTVGTLLFQFDWEDHVASSGPVPQYSRREVWETYQGQ